MPKGDSTPQLPYAYDLNAAPGANNLAKKNYLASVEAALKAKGLTEADADYKRFMGAVNQQLTKGIQAARVPALMQTGREDPTVGGSSPSASGPAAAGSGYSAWLNPHNGSVFFGIKPDGSREIITRAQAEALGAPPQKRITGDFYGRQPGDPGYEAPPPVGGGGGGGGGGSGGGGGGGGGGGSGGGGGGGGGGGSGGGGGNYSGGPGGQWNWGDWGQGAPSMNGGGGYNPSEYAFQRYVPGQESPWGVPSVKGGNKDFYRNQFLNLLQYDQNFQNNEIAAAIRREAAEKNPLKPAKMDWSWTDLPEVQVAQKAEGGDGSPYAWNLDSWIKPGATTNAEFFTHYGGDPSKVSADWRTDTSWSQSSNPDFLINSIGPGASSSWRNELSNILRQGWTRADLTPPPGGGPTAAPGYALPVAV